MLTQSLAPSSFTASSRRRSAPSLTDEAYRLLKWKILSMELPPGTWLNEQSLVESTGFSRAPVHQALHRLQSDGLVEIRPRKGVQVRMWSPEDINHLIEARIPLEAAIVRLATERAEQAEIDELNEKLAAGPDLLNNLDREGLVLLDHTFHQTLAHFSRNPVLGELVQKIHHRSMMLWSMPISGHHEYEMVITQHQAILDAIAQRDADAAVLAMTEHLSTFSTSAPAGVNPTQGT